MSLWSGFISGRHCSWGTGAAKNSLRSSLEACTLSAAILSDLVASQCRVSRVPSEQINVDAEGFAATASVSWIYESFFHRCEIISWRGGCQPIQANSAHLNLSLALHLRLEAALERLKSEDRFREILGRGLLWSPQWNCYILSSAVWNCWSIRSVNDCQSHAYRPHDTITSHKPSFIFGDRINSHKRVSAARLKTLWLHMASGSRRDR